MNVHDASASGYSASTTWCLRCDVSWKDAKVCWLCGKSDRLWKWGWETGKPMFKEVRV